MTNQPPQSTKTGNDQTPDIQQAAQFALRAPWIGAAVIIGLILLLLVPRTPAQVSIVGNCMTICFVLLPLLICLMPVYLVLAVGAFYTYRLNTYSGNKLNAINRATRTAADTAAKYGDQLSERSIGFRARFAVLNKIINTRPEGEADDELEN